MNRATVARPKNLLKTLKYLIKYLNKHAILLIIISLLVLVPSIATIYGTFKIKEVVNFAMSNDFEGIKRTVLNVGILYSFGIISIFTYMRLLAYFAQKVTYDLRRDLFEKLQDLPISYIDNHSFGNIMSNFTNDMDSLTDGLNNAFATLIQYLAEIVGMLIAIFILSWQLSLIVIAFYSLMFVYIIYSSKKSKKYYNSQQKMLGKLNGFADEVIRGEKTVKVFCHEKNVINTFNELSDELANSSRSAMKYALSMVPMVMFLSYVNYGIVTVIGGIMVINGVITSLGSLSAYLIFVRQTALPINRFTGQANLLLNSLASAERIFDLLNEENEFDNGKYELVNIKYINDKIEVSDSITGLYAFKYEDDIIPLKGDFRFVDVSFSYVEKKQVLNNISFYAKPGQKIAFVGSTGAGKTTIVSLINRFYDIKEGKILFDGIDIKDIKKDHLRKAISNVLQDTHLFMGTIEDNIKFGNLDATHEDVVNACRLARADLFIDMLPKGYDTMLTMDGLNLSQGQRQLLAIARAAISNPPILVLDEATSSIDTYTEHLIQEGMDALMKNRTVFVIAHRLSTVMNSDAIIVLENGKIIERGCHDELIDKKGRYYMLYTGSEELS